MWSWVKLWTEVNHDPKLLTLTWAQRGIWASLLALAGEMDFTDEEGESTGVLDTLEYTAIRIRCDLTEFRAAIDALEEREMIDGCDGVLRLIHFGIRQSVPPSHRKAAQRDRQRKHRAAEARHNPVTTLSKGVTPPESEKDTESESESEKELGISKPAQPSSTVHTGEVLESVALEERIGLLSVDWLDVEHGDANVSRAFNLWAQSPLDEVQMLGAVATAADRTYKRRATIRDPGKTMPYFFAVLEDQLGLRE